MTSDRDTRAVDTIAEHEEAVNELRKEVGDDDVRLQLPRMDIARRDLMKAGAAVGAAVGMSGMAGCLDLLDEENGTNQNAENGTPDHYVPPGEKDDYYAFLSGGHAGDVRVYGIPSMRQIMRIPVFNTESARGHGYDEKTSSLLEDSGGYTWGDTHHPRVSQTGNDYDGEYLFINDKAHGRMARIDLKYFEVDAIVDIPNSEGTHGACGRLPDMDLVYGVGEFRAPVPNDGRDLDDPDAYGATFTAIDRDTFNVEWQVLVDGNLDNTDSGKNGRWAFATCYNSEEGVTEPEMTRDDLDWVACFDTHAIEDALDAGEYEEISGIPVVDGTQDSPLNQGDDPVVRYVPCPTNPHGISVTPDGDYAIASGKLDPTCTIIDIDALDEVDDPGDAVVGQPEVGLGPLHTAYDGRGHAYTTLFVDSQVVKWDIQEAIEADPGSEAPVIEKIDVHYNPGHLIAAESYTADPEGDWLLVLNKLSQDRFLPVGPIFPENDQLIYIGDDDEGMQLVKDTPAYPEPHDATIVQADKLDPAAIYDPDDVDADFITPDDAEVIRDDGEVHIKMHSTRNQFSFPDVTVQEGDEVTFTVTNTESQQDIIHSLAIPNYDVQLALAPQDTREVTFTADEPGVHWMYCAYFCSALHLEMRSRLLVEPA